MESASFDEPPSYDGSVYSRRSTIPPPSYSPSPRLSELVIRSSSDASCPQEYVYRSKHITVNLGPKAWGTSFPVYGSGAIVEGTFSLFRELKSVTSVSVKLEGSVTNTCTERGLITGVTSVDILSRSFSFSSPVSGDWAQEQPFSFPLPSYVTGRPAPLPPSSILYHAGITCNIKYRLKVAVFRKGLCRNESLKVPLLYLPRTFARRPLVPFIPDSVTDPSGPSFAQDPKEIKIVQLPASSKSGSRGGTPVITLSLPAILSFAAYDTIPLALSIVCPHGPAITKLLLSTAKVQLIKRTRIWISKGRNSSEHEMLVGVAHIIRTDESRAGVSVVSYELRAARAAVQKSWTVDGVAEQQYYVRVIVRPPSSTAAHIPNYECEQSIELTTDEYDSPEREMAALGSSPSPAIGTLAAGSPDGRVGGAHLAPMSFR